MELPSRNDRRRAAEINARDVRYIAGRRVLWINSSPFSRKDPRGLLTYSPRDLHGACNLDRTPTTCITVPKEGRERVLLGSVEAMRMVLYFLTSPSPISSIFCRSHLAF